MASLRMRTPAEYLLMLWRRRYYILVPMVIVTATLVYVIYRLPNMYESITLIIVDSVNVNKDIAPSPTQIDLSSRLGTIRNYVTSRTELKGIIESFDLYSDLRRANAPEEVVLDEMQRHINLSIRNTGGGANAFTISFRYPDREIAQAVTRQLADRFINFNIDKIRQDNQKTLTQLENDAAEMRKRLEKTEADRAEFFRKYPHVIEGNDKNLMGQLQSLGMTRSTQSASIDSLRNQIATKEQYLATLKSGDFAPQEAARESDSLTKATLIAKRAEAQAKLDQLLKVFTEKHPEVREVRAQIEGYERELKKYEEEQEAGRKERSERRQTQKNPQIASLEIQIAADRREMELRQKALVETEAESRRIQELLNSIPALQNEAQKIDRDYQTIKKQYDELVYQITQVRRGAGMIAEFGGYSFRVQDPATLPEVPVAPKRGFLYPLTLALGLAAGLVVALARESRFLFTIRDARDVEHYMRLPLLVTVPQIVTEQEQRQRLTLRVVQFAGVVLLIIVAIPVLVTVIQKSRVLNIFTGAY